MRVLLLTSAYGVGFGVGLVLRKQIQGLALLGVTDVYVGVPELPADKHDDFLVKVGIDFESVRASICRIHPDIVIAHTPPYFQYIAQFNDYRVVKIAYDHGEPSPTFFDGQEIEARQHINADKYRAIGAFHYHVSISAFIKKCSGIKNSRIIYNGADHIAEAQFGDLENNVDGVALRSQLGLAPDSFLVTTLSRIGVGESYYKGYDLFCRLKRLVNQLIPDGTIEFVVMGKAVPKNNPVQAMFQEEGVLVLEGVDEKTKQQVLRQTGVYISTSLWEGFNLPLVEAQYLGVPAACFSIGAHPEVCAHHFTNVGEVAQFVKVLYATPGLRRRYATAQQQYVKRKFSWDENVKALHALLVEAEKGRGEQPVLRTQGREDSHRKDLFMHNRAKSLREHFHRNDLEAHITPGSISESFRLTYFHRAKPTVTIIIPNHNHAQDLANCLQSIYDLTTYENYQLMIVENGSDEQEVFDLYRKAKALDHKMRIVDWDKPFHYAKVNNYAASLAESEILLFLNNDVQVLTPDWIEQMLQYAQRPDIGAVGAKLYFPDGSIQHAGIVIGIRGVAGHAHRFWPGDSPGYFGDLQVVRNVSAVTAACCMMRKAVFDEVGGFDDYYGLAFNDVDLCMKVRKKGYQIIWTPYAELIHHETKTRGNDDTAEKMERFCSEARFFQERWQAELAAGDPFYSPNLSLSNENFNINV